MGFCNVIHLQCLSTAPISCIFVSSLYLISFFSFWRSFMIKWHVIFLSAKVKQSIFYYYIQGRVYNAERFIFNSRPRSVPSPQPYSFTESHRNRWRSYKTVFKVVRLGCLRVDASLALSANQRNSNDQFVCDRHFRVALVDERIHYGRSFVR